MRPYEIKKRMLDELNALLKEAIANRIFPGATVWLGRGNEIFAHEAFGTTAYDAEYSAPVTRETLYDIASLTKLFTATAFLIAARENNISLETTLAHFLSEFGVLDKREIRLRNLMQHNSGIEIAIQDLISVSPSEWIARIAQAPLHAPPTARVFYSCTNYFLLARVFEIFASQHLDEFVEARVLQPLQMLRTSWTPLQHFPKDKIAPTEMEGENAVRGIVHDEAARAWQEYSDHASCGNSGLFSTAGDLAKFAALWCDEGVANGQQILARGDVELALENTVEEIQDGVRRGLSWQVNAKLYMSAVAPLNSIGHAGFTGPTLWLNRSTRHVCIVLNNRVYPSREGDNRFPVHRQIARWLMKNSSQ